MEIGSANCPVCGQNNWHNAWLCRTCGYPDRDKWLVHIEAGYIKDNARARKLRDKRGLPHPEPAGKK